MAIRSIITAMTPVTSRRPFNPPSHMARRTTALVVACTARLVASQALPGALGSGFQDVPDVQLFQGREGQPANCQGVSGSTAMCLSNPYTASIALCANACLLTNACWVALCRIGTQQPDWNTQGSKLAAGATIAWRIPDCSPLNARGELMVVCHRLIARACCRLLRRDSLQGLVR